MTRHSARVASTFIAYITCMSGLVGSYLLSDGQAGCLSLYVGKDQVQGHSLTMVTKNAEYSANHYHCPCCLPGAVHRCVCVHRPISLPWIELPAASTV